MLISNRRNLLYAPRVNLTVFLSVCLGDVESGKKLNTIPGGKKGTEDKHVGHTAHILCMTISSDGKYLVNRP